MEPARISALETPYALCLFPRVFLDLDLSAKLFPARTKNLVELNAGATLAPRNTREVAAAIPDWKDILRPSRVPVKRNGVNRVLHPGMCKQLRMSVYTSDICARHCVNRRRLHS